MMFSFLPILWFSIKNKQARKYLVVLFIILIPLYFFIVAPLSSDLRYQYWKGQEVNKTQSLRNVLQGKASDLSNTSKNPLELFLSRSGQITPPAYIIQEVELRGFMYGGTLKYMAFSLVPRIFWKDKPMVSQSAWFTYYLGMARSPEEATSSTGITAIGELYWNFGYLGVIIGMFVLGLGFAGLWRLAGNPLNSLISMTLYIILLFSMRGFSEFGSTIVMFAILFLSFKFLFKIRDEYINKKGISKFQTNSVYFK